MGRKYVPIEIIVHAPKTKKGNCELAQCVAGVHADVVQQTIQQLDCSVEQKMQILRAVIVDVKNKLE